MGVLLNVIPEIERDGIIAHQQLPGSGQIGVCLGIVTEQALIHFRCLPYFTDGSERPDRTVANPHSHFIGQAHHLKNQCITTIGQWCYTQFVGNSVTDWSGLVHFGYPFTSVPEIPLRKIFEVAGLHTGSEQIFILSCARINVHVPIGVHGSCLSGVHQNTRAEIAFSGRFRIDMKRSFDLPVSLKRRALTCHGNCQERNSGLFEIKNTRTGDFDVVGEYIKRIILFLIDKAVAEPEMFLFTGGVFSGTKNVAGVPSGDFL